MRRLGVAIVAAIVLCIAMAFNVSADAGIDGGTNAFRQANGLGTLATSSTLTGIAQRRAVETANRTSSEGWGMWLHDFSWWGASGCSGIGENLAYKSGGVDIAWAVQSWANSPSHRANMLGNFDSIGSATYTTSDGLTFYVELFGNDCGGSAPAPAPASAAPQPVSKAPVTQSAPLALPDTAMGH